MGTEKIVIKSILTTLAAIVVLFAFMLGALMGLYPATMMELTYKLGMDDASIHYAERAYGWHGEDEYFMAYGMEVAIGMGNYEKIDVCGETLISDENFEEYCARETARLPEGVEMTYDQYVYGQVCLAKYKQGKNAEAVELAFALTKGFPKNNAILAILYTALVNEDTETVAMIKTQMDKVETDALSETEKADFQTAYALISK